MADYYISLGIMRRMNICPDLPMLVQTRIWVMVWALFGEWWWFVITSHRGHSCGLDPFLSRVYSCCRVFHCWKSECTVDSRDKKELSVLFAVNICVGVFRAVFIWGCWLPAIGGDWRSMIGANCSRSPPISGDCACMRLPADALVCASYLILKFNFLTRFFSQYAQVLNETKIYIFF